MRLQTSMVGRQVRSLSNEASKMKRQFTRVVRTSVEDVDRRNDDRVPAQGTALFVHGGGSLALDLLDVASRSISGNAEKDLLPGTEGTIGIASGVLARAIVALSVEGRIGFRFADPAEAATRVATLSGGALRRAA